jgi:hypothetical protein
MAEALSTGWPIALYWSSAKNISSSAEHPITVSMAKTKIREKNAFISDGV